MNPQEVSLPDMRTILIHGITGPGVSPNGELW